MPDNDIRAQAVELLARADYERLRAAFEDLDGRAGDPRPAWGDLRDAARDGWRNSFARHVDVLVAAGWRPPARVITTAEELDALPIGTLLLDQWRTVWRPYELPARRRGWQVVARSRLDAPMRSVLPGTVLWTPDEAKEGSDDA